MRNDCVGKNILFCLHYSGLNNGAVRSLVDVVEILVKEYNVKAYVLFPDRRGSAIDYLENLGAVCVHLPFYRIDYYKTGVPFAEQVRRNIVYCIKKIISPYNFFQAKKIISECKIDAIYSNTIVVDYGFQLSQRTDVPHIWHVREFGKEDHGLYLRKGESKLYRNLGMSHAIIYISNAIANKYRPNVKKETPQCVIYNDISTAFINPKMTFNVDMTKPLHAAIIGTIQEGKGQLEAICAVENVNKDSLKIILHIAGKEEGTYYKQLQFYVKSHRLDDSVIFDGFIKDVNTYRNKMDVGIVASANEAFGRVTIEGMLSGLAIIGANAAGTLELIENNVDGFLYPKGDTEQLAALLVKFYKNRNLMKQIAETGYRQAVDKYTTHRAAKQIANLLNEI